MSNLTGVHFITDFAEIRQKCSNAQACLKSFLAYKALYSVIKFLAKNGDTAHLEN